jgi:hypothetical protein
MCMREHATALISQRCRHSSIVYDTDTDTYFVLLQQRADWRLARVCKHGGDMASWLAADNRRGVWAGKHALAQSPTGLLGVSFGIIGAVMSHSVARDGCFV